PPRLGLRRRRRGRRRLGRRSPDERLRGEADLALAVLDARVDEDADERAEEAVAGAEPALAARRLDQPATHLDQQVLGDGVEVAAYGQHVGRARPQARP